MVYRGMADIGDDWDEYVCIQHVRRLDMSRSCVSVTIQSPATYFTCAHSDALVSLPIIIQHNIYYLASPWFVVLALVRVEAHNTSIATHENRTEVRSHKSGEHYTDVNR